MATTTKKEKDSIPQKALITNGNEHWSAAAAKAYCIEANQKRVNEIAYI